MAKHTAKRTLAATKGCRFKTQFAVFHKYHDGDFVCYGPDGLFFDNQKDAEDALIQYDSGSSEGRACIVPVLSPTRKKEKVSAWEMYL